MSLRKAANEMCKACIYDKEAAGTWLEQVEQCKMDTCPLYDHRPVTNATVAARRAEKRILEIITV